MEVDMIWFSVRTGSYIIRCFNVWKQQHVGDPSHFLYVQPALTGPAGSENNMAGKLNVEPIK